MGTKGLRGGTQDRLNLPLASFLKSQEVALALGYGKGRRTGAQRSRCAFIQDTEPSGVSGLHV